MLRTTTVGNYPKLPSKKGDVNIRRLFHRYDKKEITTEELESAFKQVTARVVGEQMAAGVDLPTDGQIRWDDIVTPFAAGAEGIEINGLIRWFDNNVYYRKPVIVSEIRHKRAVAAKEYKLAMAIAGKPIKAVLPAPFSFSRLSENRHYKSEDNLIADLAKLLHEEAKALVEAGATHIQLDEPCLPFEPDQAEFAAEALNEAVKGLAATFWVCFYFGNLEKIATRLKAFNVGVIAADCVSHPENVDYLVTSAQGKNACFGVIEARNIKLEKMEVLQKTYRKIAAAYPDAYISPSCGLEFLPHASALEKVNLLGESVKSFNGRQAHA